MFKPLFMRLNQNMLMKSGILTVFVFVVLACGAQSAVPTFECIGLYWSPGNGSPTIACSTSYREANALSWKKAIPLWYDTGNLEYRGSIVNLKPNTTYQILLSLQGTSTSTTLSTTTWNEDFPIVKTVNFPAGISNQTITISQSGTASGYILY